MIVCVGVGASCPLEWLLVCCQLDHAAQRSPRTSAAKEQIWEFGGPPSWSTERHEASEFGPHGALLVNCAGER